MSCDIAPHVVAFANFWVFAVFAVFAFATSRARRDALPNPLVGLLP
jgi:hypothetical protein